MVDHALRDLRHAARGLRARPAFTLVNILTLTLVIGAAGAVFSVVSATMIRPLPFPDADRIVQVALLPPRSADVANRTPLDIRTFVRLGQSVRQVDAFDGFWARDRALGSDAGDPESITAGGASPGAFALFGGTPLVGRTFTVDEDRANARVVVLSYGLWQRRFGGDTRAIGRIVSIDREPHLIIGVMPAAFQMAYTPMDLWTPLNASEAGFSTAATLIQSYARLREGATVPQLQSELEAAMGPVILEAPVLLTGWMPKALTLRAAQFGAGQGSLLALMGAVIALVLLASANLTNVMLAQVIGKRHERALRAALGGGRAAALRLQLWETALIAAGGGGLGLLLGAWTLPALLAIDPTTARTFGDVHLDWRVQLTAGAAALLVAGVSGLLPLSRELGGDLARGIADGSRRAAGRRGDLRLRHVLVAAQAAMAVMLLTCGGLFLSAYDRSSRIEPGFDSSNVLGAQMRISASAYTTEAARAQLISRVLERVRAAPGVVAAATTLTTFTPGGTFVTQVDIEGKPSSDGQQHVVQFRRISSQYFKTMRIPLVRGRDFTEADTLDARRVAIVSRRFADQFWPGEDPVGQGIRRGANRILWTVVGVVEDVSDGGFAQAPAPTVYLCFTQNNVAITPVSLVVRTHGDPAAMTSVIRQAVLQADPAQPIDHVTTLEQYMADSLGPQRFRSTLLLVLAGLGVVLAAVGIYGVTARAVSERTRELGVRLALGATSRRVAALVVWQAVRAVALGLAAGVALAIPAGAALLRTLPNLDQAEPWSTVPAVLILLSVAIVAAAIPARRAVSLDPTVALRAE
jgi:predicted permease